MAFRVLFVDDEPRALAGLARSLRSHEKNWEPEFVEGGRAALDRVRSGGIDLVVTDIFMPDLDGFELIRELSRITPTTPVIVISGGGRYGMTDIVRAARAFGAARAMVKPVNPEALVEAIRELLPDEGTKEPGEH